MEAPQVNIDNLMVTASKFEQQYRSFLETALDGIWITDTAGQLLEVNDVYCTMSGYSKNELIGLLIRDLEVVKDAPNIAPRLKRVIEKGSDRFESKHGRKDGTLFDAEVSAQFLPEEGGRAIFFFRDISKPKQDHLALQRSEEKFRIFAEQSQVAFYIVEDELFTYVNPKFADILGYTVEECLDNMHIGLLAHPDDLPALQQRIQERTTNQLPISQYNFRAIKKTGEIIHVTIYGKYIRHQDKILAIGSLFDITNDLEKEQRMVQSQRVEAIGVLAGGIAHDFNNILTPIVGMSELLLENFPNNSREWKRSEKILKAGLRGRDLVKQILTFSLQSEHKMIPTRIQSLLEEVIKLSRSTIPSSIEIKQDIQPDIGLIMGDPTQIHQVTMNLVTNAYHAIGINEGEICVSLKQTVWGTSDRPHNDLKPGKYAVLTISDTGHGIPADCKDKIFEPYFTTKDQGKGTGLGLAVVNGIVKEHRGTIKVKSEAGKGATFSVFFPLIDMIKKTEAIDVYTPPPCGSERILLVDDDAAVLDLHKAMLEHLGYKVTDLNSSVDAVKAFRTKPTAFDLVVSDMTMPDMTGDQLAHKLVAIQPKIPIVICTGFSEKINGETAAPIGVKGILKKPITMLEMGSMIRKVLDKADGAAQK